MQDVGPFAYGVLGLHPWELRKYTLREFSYKVAGYADAERADWRRFAALACWVLAPFTDKDTTLTPDRLLGFGPH